MQSFCTQRSWSAMTEEEELQIREIGEQGLLRRVQQFCPLEIVGDDAALLSVSPGQSLVVTTDVLVDGVHFSVGMARPGIQTTHPADAGWRAVAANLSDLAAMGAMPLGITVGLSLPGEMPVAWIESLYQGMTECLEPYQTPIVGGDLCRSSVLMVAITAFGQVNPTQAIRRSAAQPGYQILTTGVHGASRAGLELLLHPQMGKGLAEGDRAYLIAAHQRPVPRLDMIPHLQALWEMNPALSIAGMDSSDGLADAVLQICRTSGVGACLNRSAIPIPPSLATWVSSTQAVEWSLYGGEDFELVLCLPPEGAAFLQNRLGKESAIIGTITSDLDVILADQTGLYPDEILTLDRGFQHFEQV